ncbi:hypothetical protein ACFFUS_16475 [Vibrio gallaecicus]|nr:hypothetical protein [Vibrio gallaecicus]
MKIILAFVISFFIALPTYAGTTSATELGPLVDCTLPSGDTDYIPSMMCRINGGMKG